MGELLDIILWPSLTLKEKSLTISDKYIPSEEFKKLIDDMFWTMYRYQGVGLAAIQVNRPLRVFVMDCKKFLFNNEVINGKPMVFINPEIVECIDDRVLVNEGCLSFPGISEKTMRYPEIIIEAKDMTGESHRWQMCGLEAQCAQHEIEHLNGITIGDNWGIVKRDIVKRKINKNR